MEFIILTMLFIVTGAALLCLKLSQQTGKNKKATYVCNLCNENHCECSQHDTGN